MFFWCRRHTSYFGRFTIFYNRSYSACVISFIFLCFEAVRIFNCLTKNYSFMMLNVFGQKSIILNTWSWSPAYIIQVLIYPGLRRKFFLPQILFRIMVGFLRYFPATRHFSNFFNSISSTFYAIIYGRMLMKLIEQGRQVISILISSKTISFQ